MNFKSFGSLLDYIVIVRCPPLAVMSNYIVVWRDWWPLIAIVAVVASVANGLLPLCNCD